MENLNYVITVECETPEVEKRYKELAQRMLKDEAFFEKCKTTKSMEELYMVYKEFGYTDLEYPDFETQFTDLFSALPLTEEGVRELTTKDLEQVVGGGLNIFEAIMTAINLIPCFGPLITAAARSAKAGIEGKGPDAMAMEVGKGMGLFVLDTIILVTTAGLGTVAQKMIVGGAGVAKSVITNITPD